MKRYNLLARLVRSLCVIAVAAAWTFTGCTEVDDTLGTGFAPGSQQMKIGRRTLKSCFKTLLYRTDSIRTSNITVGLMGSTKNDTFGVRTAGFYTQYTWGYCPDSTEGFGYRPIFDSILLGLSVTGCGGDTTAVNTFEVYEIVNDEFLAKQADTVFYADFDIEPYLSADPVFTFDFPDQEKGVYTTSTAVRMMPTEAGADLIDRLMLKKGAYAGNKMEGFFDPSDWVGNFKGLYIRPKTEATSKESGIYQLDISASGMILYGRNRVKEDPTLIRDTTISLYYFYDNATEAGRASINTIRHDYSQSLLADLKFDEPKKGEPDQRSETATCYVEGMGGVVTEIVLTEDFFEQLETILKEENAAQEAAGVDERLKWKSLVVNQAILSIYDAEGDYRWEDVVPSESMIDRMNSYMNRLGLYTSYKKLTAIADYAYVYEANYGLELNYGGYINRSQGCYTMDIAMYVQALWNKFNQLRASDADRSTAELLEELGKEARTLYLAPEAYGVNGFRYMTGQGMEGGGNKAPMKLELTYTLIK